MGYCRVMDARALSLALLAATAAAGCKSLSEEKEAVTPDADVDCGDVDELCCDLGAACLDDLLCVAGAVPETPEDHLCLSRCSVPACVNIAGNDGVCEDVGLLGNTGACLADEDFEPVTCVEGTGGCTTPSGATSETICLTDGEDTFCFERCTITDDECDDAHTCLSTLAGGGVCVPD